MECAYAIGATFAVCYSASANFSFGIDEFLFTGFIRILPVPLVKDKTVDLERLCILLEDRYKDQPELFLNNEIDLEYYAAETRTCSIEMQLSCLARV
jgi:hypothetical protein